MGNYIDAQLKALIDNGLTPGMAVSFGDLSKTDFVCSGYTDDSHIKKADNKTIVDLASITKLFLAFAFLSANETMPIHFDNCIKYYCGNLFPYIKDYTLDELFHFDCNLVTDKMIVECDYEEAKRQIYNIKPKAFSKPTYSDMPALVLGYIFKVIYDIEFGDFVDRNIIKKYHLKNTFWKSPKTNTLNYFNYDNEMVVKNNSLIHHNQKPFEINDKKAEILSCTRKYLCGNAGLFSTAEDMSIVARAILNRELLNENSLLRISDNYDDKYDQRFGYLCYRKSPNKVLSEVSEMMSDKAFAISGFTGTYYMIDPINDCFLFMAGNRLNNRITFTDNPDLILSETKIIFDEKTFNYSKDYVYIKDSLRDACCQSLLNSHN